MQFTANIDYKSLSEAFNKFPLECAKELRKAVATSCKTITRDAQLHHKFKSKSNQLERSMQFKVSPSGLTGTCFLDEGIAIYGKYVHDGTRPHIIKPKSRKALYFVSRGNKQFAKSVNHPGTRPDQFLYQAAERGKPFFNARVEGAVNSAKKIAGL